MSAIRIIRGEYRGKTVKNQSFALPALRATSAKTRADRPLEAMAR